MKPVRYPYTAEQLDQLLGMLLEQDGLTTETIDDVEFDQYSTQVDSLVLSSIPFVAEDKPLIICRLAEECAYPHIEVINVDAGKLLNRLQPDNFDPQPANSDFWARWEEFAAEFMTRVRYKRWTGEPEDSCAHEYKRGTATVSNTQIGVHMIYRCHKCNEMAQVYIGPSPSPPDSWKVV